MKGGYVEVPENVTINLVDNNTLYKSNIKSITIDGPSKERIRILREELGRCSICRGSTTFQTSASYITQEMGHLHLCQDCARQLKSAVAEVENNTIKKLVLTKLMKRRTSDEDISG